MIEFKEPDMIVIIINRRCSNDVQLMELKFVDYSFNL